MRGFFIERSSRRLYRVYVMVVSVGVLISWPSNPVSYYIQFSSKPITLPLSFMVTFIFTYFLSLIPEFSDKRGKNTITDWVYYTPVSIATVFLGYFLYSIAHVGFLLALVAPLLIIAAAASGVATTTMASACLIVFAYSLFSKQFLHMLTLIFEERPFLRVVIFGLGIIFSILLSLRLFPVANPIVAAQSALIGIEAAMSADGPGFVAWQKTVMVYAVGTAAVSVVSVLRLGLLRREAEISDE
jgi:hypothetical protein